MDDLLDGSLVPVDEFVRYSDSSSNDNSSASCSGDGMAVEHHGDLFHVDEDSILLWRVWKSGESHTITSDCTKANQHANSAVKLRAVKELWGYWRKMPSNTWPTDPPLVNASPFHKALWLTLIKSFLNVADVCRLMRVNRLSHLLLTHDMVWFGIFSDMKLEVLLDLPEASAEGYYLFFFEARHHDQGNSWLLHLTSQLAKRQPA
uniref:F-box domain-containing protein n=1 Tax=Trypanosoma vivax (strain Y486) TaxID=1055687 RepID=G0U6Z2_TRYVY|nr:hypothetical protein TVY486_1006960 [Trypanosoma vivax Y486]